MAGQVYDGQKDGHRLGWMHDARRVCELLYTSSSKASNWTMSYALYRDHKWLSTKLALLTPRLPTATFVLSSVCYERHFEGSMFALGFSTETEIGTYNFEISILVLLLTHRNNTH